MASNIGSTATITGNPQNILIGTFSAIPYVRFAEALSPVALAGLVVAGCLMLVLHRQEFAAGSRIAPPDLPSRGRPILMLRALAAVFAVIALFFVGAPPAKAAIIVGAMLLLTRRIRSVRI